MAQKIVIEVTPDLVERATKRDSRHCMIAEAIKRKDPDRYTQVYVDLQTIRWSDRKTGKRYTALTPTVAAQLLVDFDQGKPLEPVAFAAKVIKISDSKQRGRAAKYDAKNQLVIGGPELPKAHLRGTASSGTYPGRVRDVEAARAAKLPPDNASNIELSKAAYRLYGRRLLQA
jgi:hypothetical protein